MPLSLPDVTVVCIDNVAQDLARMALGSTLQVIEPAQVLFWTDIDPPLDGPKYRELPFHGRGKEAADQPLWYQVPVEVKTSHFLTVQWDGWAINASAWQPAFLDYDYIGAPWHWHEFGQVGNGGFSLRSRRLAAYLAEHRDRFPYRFPEDDVIGRVYRPALEAAGFRFPPVELAMRFSFEHPHHDRRIRRVPSFGFHDVRNWGWALSDAEIDARLAAASAYVVKKTDLIAQMLTLRDHYRALQAAA
jgi:hypothetical protein